MVGPFQFRVGGKVEENVPRNILEKILWLKDGEVAAFKERTPPSALALALDGAPPARDFVGALQACEAETGDAHPDRGGEEGGSFENLEFIRAAGMGSPLLCKDFVVDAWQLYCARTKGADTVLLIATVLPDQDLCYHPLPRHGHPHRGASLPAALPPCRSAALPPCHPATLLPLSVFPCPITLVHREREMERVLALEGITLISINNRNLGTPSTSQCAPPCCALPRLPARCHGPQHVPLPHWSPLAPASRQPPPMYCMSPTFSILPSSLPPPPFPGTFKVDLGNTQQLLAKERGAAIRERGIMVVGESGLFIPGDVAFVQKAGCNAVSRRMPAQLALIVSTSVYPPRLHPLLPSSTRLPPQVLVGESLVRTSDPTAAIAALFGRPLTTHQPGQPEPAQAQALA
ncbi:unnamed protein product [Closterium sp. NIES-65]|nr:unnamed protein product [Closterium sp. NIES-65]